MKIRDAKIHFSNKTAKQMTNYLNQRTKASIVHYLHPLYISAKSARSA